MYNVFHRYIQPPAHTVWPNRIEVLHSRRAADGRTQTSAPHSSAETRQTRITRRATSVAGVGAGRWVQRRPARSAQRRGHRTAPHTCSSDTELCSMHTLAHGRGLPATFPRYGTARRADQVHSTHLESCRGDSARTTHAPQPSHRAHQILWLLLISRSRSCCGSLSLCLCLCLVSMCTPPATHLLLPKLSCRRRTGNPDTFARSTSCCHGD